jgi:hypothetical protein
MPLPFRRAAALVCVSLGFVGVVGLSTLMKKSRQIIWFCLIDIEIDAPKTDKGALTYTRTKSAA